MEEDEKFQDWLARQGIKWQFNLSRAPWWGGQFERLVGLLKQSLYKTIGNGNLQWKEVHKVILDVEITLNNRPLGYMEDNVELPVLTPNSLLFGQPNILPEMDPSGIEEADSGNVQDTFSGVKKPCGEDGPENMSKHSESDTTLSIKPRK